MSQLIVCEDEQGNQLLLRVDMDELCGHGICLLVECRKCEAAS